MSTVTILHTNDFHNHLSPEQANRLAEWRRTLGNSGLLLDAGDAISSGNVTYKPGGEPILDLMNSAGYDAMTVGNREFHFTQAGFCAKVGRARFPVLCANVRARDASTKLPVVPSITRTLSSGIRVTVFGLTVPMITERMLVRKVSAYVFDDPLRVADDLAPKLRKDCDLLICLSHVGLAHDRRLAERRPEIDLIIGGHTHALLEHGGQIRNTTIAQAGWFAKYVGTITVEFGGQKPSIECRVDPL